MTGSSRANGLKRFANGTELIPQRDKFLIPSVYDSHILVLKMEKKPRPRSESLSFYAFLGELEIVKKPRRFSFLGPPVNGFADRLATESGKTSRFLNCVIPFRSTFVLISHGFLGVVLSSSNATNEPDFLLSFSKIWQKL